MNLPVYIFDVDGTLTAERYVNDHVVDLRPNTPVLNIALSLQSSGDNVVAVVTARESHLREDTILWLEKHGLFPRVLELRNSGDGREDHNVRVDQVHKVMKKLNSKSAVLFDDRLHNCALVEARLGVPCIHIRS